MAKRTTRTARQAMRRCPRQEIPNPAAAGLARDE